MKLKIQMRALILALLVNCVSSAEDRVLGEVFRTRERLEMLQNADNVDACILSHQLSLGEDKRDVRYTEGQFKLVSAEEVSILAASLTDSANYRWDTRIGTIPIFHARVRFFKAGHILTANFDFSSSVMRLAYDGEPFSGALIYGANEAIFGVLKKLFPDDDTIIELTSSVAARARLRRDAEKGKKKDKPTDHP